MTTPLNRELPQVAAAPAGNPQPNYRTRNILCSIGIAILIIGFISAIAVGAYTDHSGWNGPFPR